MERITRKQAERAFELLTESLGKRIATDYKDIGAWRLDYAACYGGYVIEEILSDKGGVRHPIDSRRHNAREFVAMCFFARDILRFHVKESAVYVGN